MKLLCFLLIFLGGNLFAYDHFERCEKTYVDPKGVSLHKNTIEVAEEGVKTSAIYADRNGLYYRDRLVPKKKEKIDLSALFHVEDLITITDEQIDPIAPFEEKVEPLIITDKPIESPKPKAPSSQLKKKGVWPFCDKQR